MKRILLTISLILLFAGQVCFCQERPLANENLTGRYARSIEQVLRLEPDEIDIGTAALIISEKWSDLVHGRRHLAELDDMAYEIRRRLEEQGLENSPKAVNVINKYLFDELGFTSVAEADETEDLFLHTVLDKKHGYCLSLSILYLAIGERLGLPLYGVVVPKHFFVRYDDGRVRFNIETTSKGGYADDEHYIKEFRVPPDHRSSIYMENLDKLQSLGCFFNNLGNCYSDIGEPDQAMVALERSVDINPSLAESRTNLGNIYLQKDRVDDAIYQYNRAMEIYSGDAKMHNNLGNAYTRKEWFDDAIREYETAIALEPEYLDSYKSLSYVYTERQMFGLARVRLRQAIDLAPGDNDLYKRLGDVYAKEENYEQAIYQYKKATQLNRKFAEAYYALAVCYNKLGRVDDEIDAYKQTLASKPNMFEALANLGNAYFSKENYKAAITQYKKAIRINPNESSLHYNLGAACSNKKDYAQAEGAYLNALKLEPEMAGAHKGLVFVLYKLKDYKAAMEHAQKAEQLGADVDPGLVKAIKKKL